MKRILLFAATEKGFASIQKLVNKGYRNNIGCVVTFEEAHVDKNWQVDICSLCEANHIPHIRWKEAKSQLSNLIHSYSITGAIAISWRYLIPTDINDHLEDPLIVFHDSLLPKYRGFAPTPTAIICGEENIGVTALFATNEVDAGDIILQKCLYVPQDMYIQNVIHKQSELYADMLVIIIDKMRHGALHATPQNPKLATYSIWRDLEDCHINWENSSMEIFNFIRAVDSPYPGAFSFYNNIKIIIKEAAVWDCDLTFAIRQPGKLWAISDRSADVICGKGMLRILRAINEQGEDIRFDRLRCRLT